MQKFVGVRLVQGNGLDLKLFQFDWDLTFAVFFLNADRTIYGRFGSRSDHADAERDISLAGFNKAMAQALKWHADHGAMKSSLAGKIGGPPRFERPELYPSLKQFKTSFELTTQGNNCLHCHQIGGAEKRFFRESGKPIPDDVLFPHPMPDVVGLRLDPQEMARVKSVIQDSPAAKAGLRAGDDLVALAGQPLLSIADVQWVLHHAGDAVKLTAKIRRGEETREVALDLPAGWRRQGDIAWRSTAWDLRRMTTGGLVLEELAADGRKKLGLADDALALRVKYVGQYGQHAAGRDAGFRVNDVIVEFGDLKERGGESQLFAYAAQKLKPQQRVTVVIRRGDQRHTLTLPQQQ